MVEFILNKKLLCSISKKGLFEGEIQSTKELLAYENNVSIKDIIINKKGKN